MLLEKIHLEDDEKVLAIIRKHWWIIATQTFSVLVMAVFPLGLILGIQQIEMYESIIGTAMTDYATELAFGYVAWLIILWMMLANFWTDHYLDLWAVTSRRVVLVDQRGFFSRFISSFRLERLQDMNLEIKGILPTLLDYGTVEAQTAGGSNEEFISRYMPHPREIKALIVRAADDLTHEQSARIENLKSQGL